MAAEDERGGGRDGEGGRGAVADGGGRDAVAGGRER